MNVAFVALLIWRASIALPFYFSLLKSLAGVDTIIHDGYGDGSGYGANTNINININIKTLTWYKGIVLTVQRTAIFFFDFVLARFIVLWPVEFFFGRPENPVSWRWKVGLRDEEIVVRKSRGWEGGLRGGWMVGEEEKGVERKGERNKAEMGPMRDPETETEKTVGEEVYTERIKPAIDPEWLENKTGYLMLDKNWDLDFGGMVAAHRAIDQGKATINDFDMAVIVHDGREHTPRWMIWRINA